MSEKFQTIGTLVALIISFSALFVSIYEANILKSQQKAAVWPYLKVTEQYDSNGFGFDAVNNGTGPAIVTSVQVDYKNSPVNSMDALLDSLKPGRTFGYDILTNNTINNQVLKAGDKIRIFGLPYTDETRKILDKIKHVRVQIEYKSVLDDYWHYDSKDGSVIQEKFKSELEFKN